MSSPNTAYRPDIDGLRALAVLPVVAFHLGIRPAEGGFVGVDVFFVISGYLIARLIFAELREGSFSLGAFYARRIRRLFPALFAMLAITTAIAWFVLYPIYFEDYGESLAAAALSASNFYFWSTADYFTAPVETKPLLHTWSLAVEEQFYLVFPLVAAFVLRRGVNATRLLFVALFALSLAAGSVAAFADRQGAFYLPHLRAWELLLGVLLALGVRPKLPELWMRSTAALAGLAAIVAPVLLYSDSMPFPGLAALPPCLGAALLIAAGEDGRHHLTPVLSWRPIVFVGLISYSLYLWHWPIITLYQQYTADLEIPWMRKALLAIASVAVAYFSWRFIEKPFRKPGASTRTVLAAGGGLILASVTAGVFIVTTNGAPSRFDPEIVRIAGYINMWDGVEEDPQAPNCFLDGTANEPFSTFDRARCIDIDASRPNILLFGDSHAGHLIFGLREELPHANVLQATATHCEPLLGVSGDDVRGCTDLVTHVYDAILAGPNDRLDLIIIAARWEEDDLRRIEDSLRSLNDHAADIVFVGPTAEYIGAVPQLVAMGMHTRDQDLADRSIAPGIASLDEELRSLVEGAGVTYFSAFEAFCPSGDCEQMSPQGVPYQWDYGHLTPEGSSFVVSRILDQLAVTDIGSPSDGATPH